ncbi:MAG: oligosaccharide flippase family protein [Lactovum sp.]
MNNSNTDNQLQQEKMLTGTAWLSMANIISRLLGALYIIPWYAWMSPYSNQANTLFSMGYNIYALFLLLSTVGIPVAIAKEVAHYNALDDKNMTYRLVRQMFLFMLVLGIIMSAFLYFFAPALAIASGGDKALIPVMRSLSLSILIFPAMSVIRGYFQGLNDMKTFAISQVYEQIIRIIWMLVTTYIIMQLGNKNWQAAVTQSTTAAFIGMLASCLVLFINLVKNNDLKNFLSPKESKQTVRAFPLLKQTVITALPFVITGSAIQIFKLIDQMSFVNVMLASTDFSRVELNDFFAYFSANTDKITMILIAVALTLGDVGLPLITTAFTKKKMQEVSYLISYNFQFFVAFMLPAVVGVSLLAKPIYTLFYSSPNLLQERLFIYASLQSFILTLLALSWLFLQSMHENKKAMLYFSLTLLIKIIIQVPSILLFEVYGPLIATTIAFLVGIFLTIRKIKEISHFDIKELLHICISISLLTLVMSFIVVIIQFLYRQVIPADNFISSLIIIILAGTLGLYSYLFLAAKTGLLEKLMGERGRKIRNKLHI